jgi:uncharacterized protein
VIPFVISSNQQLRREKHLHPANAIRVSRHLHISKREDGAYVAFHALFGNASVLDNELAASIQRLRETSGSKEFFAAEFGEEIATQLHDSYYLASENEERSITEHWLAERASLVSSGYYLGGLQISSSNACNFACSYCFADRSDERSAERRKGASTPNITFETACEAIEKVLATAEAHGRSRIGVKFLGREPLVNFKVMSRLFEHYSTERIVWSMTTNGSLITPEISKQLAKVNAIVVVSIDGLPEVNDALRVLKVPKKGQSTYDMAMHGFERLVAAGVKCSISSVVSAKTDFATMPSFLRIVRDAGCREIELTLAMQTGTLQAQQDDANKLVRQLVALYVEAAKLGLHVSGDWIDPYHAILANHKFRVDRAMTRPQGVGCQATEHQISVEPNGDLFPCRAMSLHYGSLANWDAVLNGDAYRKVVMRTFYAVPYCQSCPLEGHCQGTCLGSLEQSTGDILSPQESYCNIYRDVSFALLTRNVGAAP